ncbi:hypothetical protein Pyn_37149 [Prunus yedoensis var. nudiflora]|uniref:Uncharacterized protein n=1 Tax=Prunus yedoensis var. nudiflora TaxID=2094558 RepID=A0A314YCH1_PRUYE|nr:hypothetical protein Pyn_37149 [Prunus yedoensis var. nudiflora]
MQALERKLQALERQRRLGAGARADRDFLFQNRSVFGLVLEVLELDTVFSDVQPPASRLCSNGGSSGKDLRLVQPVRNKVRQLSSLFDACSYALNFGPTQI